MRKGILAATCLAAVLLGAVMVSAQSLADVARAEEARRKAMGKAPGKAGKVYTNDDLNKSGGAPPPPPDTAAKPAEGSTASNGGAAASTPAAAAPAPAAGAATPPAPAEPPKDEKYWRARMTNARAALQRSQAFLDALQSHINGLWAEFTSIDDPIQRAGIEKKRNEAIAEQDRVKADIQQQTKAIAAVEEEARRASVPPGWLR